jgi:hypothetical protein
VPGRYRLSAGHYLSRAEVRSRQRRGRRATSGRRADDVLDRGSILHRARGVLLACVHLRAMWLGRANPDDADLSRALRTLPERLLCRADVHQRHLPLTVC